MEKNENSLMLVFKDDSSNTVSLTLRNAKEGVDDLAISSVMDDVIASGCILTNDGEPVSSKVKFAYIDKTTTELHVIL
ncbi:DUF2922 domain-containing protein [Clostridium tarantellae]|uniref:DUF2922 family protein n=1 Tax=Clostridium tarantellae TaxID=39493 RepID=A0A6I1MS12_9CLOT|nr:DUF2922 domain-containing protein [Clostridium tarantellae]MPQ44987.1 DUF2922 family protein [Clostridium tarantellae]